MSTLLPLVLYLLAPLGFMLLLSVMIAFETKGDPLVAQRVLEDGMRELDLRMEDQPWGVVYFTVGKRTGSWVPVYFVLAWLGWPLWVLVQFASVRAVLDRYTGS